MSAKNNEDKQKTTSTIARSEDGTIQITFTIAYSQIEKAKKESAASLGKDIEIPGFRKGQAPLEKVIQHIPENTLLEKTLSLILPKLVSDAIEKHKIKPAIYPRFELVSAKEKDDWQIRAITCEIPEVMLGDYKKAISNLAKPKIIWTPDKKLESEQVDKKKSREVYEQEVLKLLLEMSNLKIPKILIDEEVNSRLSKLLQRLEKLGLTLESYLSSIGKTAELLRGEYEKQSTEAISLDLILSKITQLENIQVEESEIDRAIDAASVDEKLTQELATPERRKFIEVILKRRKALDYLVSLTS